VNGYKNDTLVFQVKLILLSGMFVILYTYENVTLHILNKMSLDELKKQQSLVVSV